MKWLPIETAPTDGTSVLLLVGEYITTGRYEKTENYNHGKLTSRRNGWSADNFLTSFRDINPYHWMPIPPLPQADPGAD